MSDWLASEVDAELEVEVEVEDELDETLVDKLSDWLLAELISLLWLAAMLDEDLVATTATLLDLLATGGAPSDASPPPLPPHAVISKGKIKNKSTRCIVISQFRLDVSTTKTRHAIEPTRPILRSEPRLLQKLNVQYELTSKDFAMKIFGSGEKNCRFSRLNRKRKSLGQARYAAAILR